MSDHYLNPELYSEYLTASVGNYLQAPLIPDAGEIILDELKTPEQIKERANVQICDPITDMALIDKRFAHATREVMWLHTGEEPIPTLTDYFDQNGGSKKAEVLFDQMAGAATEAEKQADYVALSWSSDPHTRHRPSIQGEKRLHFHLAGRNGELKNFNQIVTPIASLNFVDRQRLAEEYSFAATQYIKDVIENDPEVDLPATTIHPCVLSLEVGDWDQLPKPEFLTRLGNFLNRVENHYHTIVSSLGEENDRGHVNLQSSDEYIENIREESGLDESSLGLQLLIDYIKRLKIIQSRYEVPANFPPVINPENINDRTKRLLTAVTPSAGMSYAGNFSRHNDTLYFNFRPCKFSDLGGAGCAFLFGMPVRVKKGGPAMTEEQLKQRQAFVEQTKEIMLGKITSRNGLGSSG